MANVPIIKVRDVLYPRLQVPDLDAMESFLMDFGLSRAHRTDDRLYMRCAGSAAYAHVVHLGEPQFLGFAFEVNSREDLELLAASEGFTPIEARAEPDGGWRSTARDLDGNMVEAVFGQVVAAPLPCAAPRKLNMGDRFDRIGELQRIQPGPSRVKRFGHLALNVADPAASLDWYNRGFGLIASDRINLAPGIPAAIFSRCDRGADPADHHTILFASNMGAGGVSGLNHLSWEVCDIDDVHAGSEHLAAKKRSQEWGVGRHLLGSQIFDYWRDPWGHIHEHWTDGDQLDASVPAGDHPLAISQISQWGPDMPATFGRTILPQT
jgi:catechol 2,3-dioxygenase-like lactoylglutathione lyase family enzyme